ncbi:Cyclin, N-terminal domain containing protein [Trichomonas vaginalis G3]|uniref:Cyclin, N-terminal domain containing protein n=1 Tax=Trichomonas vaginalis (strain ATCC PRA-98 / G3) TaxID=412133 RepID=A2ELN2_TRIV3|nr:cyclin-like family [Trichomonas vaginalis G3]EAY06479.1 Cyclin, N-terminal domain containing protein [Trichomonas vaginalis G3]KAI5510062.1 cyclin-like family [Trichomonas vaginalis G3]|eukprot:XP_001318702.1 Cyclin, N-terminal domain containing protein [Trichomonas vaginalis G3]
MMNILPKESNSFNIIGYSKWFSDSKLVADSTDMQSEEEEDYNDTIQIAACNNSEDIPVIYEKKIFGEYMRQENIHQIKNNANLDHQNSISELDRDMVINWLLLTSISESLSHHTIALAVKIFDYVIQVIPLDRSELKIYAATSMLMASKLEEEDSTVICERLCSLLVIPTKNLLVKTELKILHILDYDLRFITPFMYIEHFIAHHTSPRNNDLILKLKQLSKAITYASILSYSSTQFTSYEIAKNIFELCLYYTHIHHYRPDNECCRHILNALSTAFDETGSLRSIFPYLVPIFN